MPTILFLAANPLGAERPAVDEEARAIQQELQRARHRFELVTRWAVRPMDLLRALRQLKPTIVHFIGHGSDNRDGLIFQGPDGRPQLVSSAALAEAFSATGSSVKLVVLNACYSDVQAEVLRTYVNCVVGMHGSIRDDAARKFAIAFYGGLGEGESVAAAYKQGRAAIILEGLPDSDMPQLKVRDGVDADQPVLAMWDLAVAQPTPTAPGAPIVALAALPLPTAPFLGRGRELRALDRTWDRDDDRVVSIVASGGTGKSALLDRWLSTSGATPACACRN